jgi:trigger factor
LKVDHDEVHTLEVDVDFTIEEINTTELAELNQELFDAFGEGVASIDELKAKIKEDAEAQFATQADQNY